MKKIILISLFTVIPFLQVNAVPHLSKTVGVIKSPDINPCSLFTLVGVAEADPIKPGNNWFAVPQTHNGHNVIISILLAASTSGKTVTVYTNGKEICGGVEVDHVRFD